MKLNELQESIARTELRVAQGRARSALLYRAMGRSLRSRLPVMLLAVFAGAAALGFFWRRRRITTVERQVVPRGLPAEQRTPGLLLTLWAVIGAMRQAWKLIEPFLRAIESRARDARDTRDRSTRGGSRR